MPPYHLPLLFTNTHGFALTFTLYFPDVWRIEIDGHDVVSLNAKQMDAALIVTLRVEVCGHLTTFV